MKRYVFWGTLVLALLVLAAAGWLARGTARAYRILTRKEGNDVRLAQLQP